MIKGITEKGSTKFLVEFQGFVKKVDEAKKQNELVVDEETKTNDSKVVVTSIASASATQKRTRAAMTKAFEMEYVRNCSFLRFLRKRYIRERGKLLLLKKKMMMMMMCLLLIWHLRW